MCRLPDLGQEDPLSYCRERKFHGPSHFPVCFFVLPMIYGPSLVELFDGIVAKTQQALVFEVDMKHNAANSPWRGSPMGGTPHGGDPQGGNPHGGAPPFSLFLEVRICRNCMFLFTFLLVANCFVDHFEFSSEWHILKFDSAFDTLYGQP